MLKLTAVCAALDRKDVRMDEERKKHMRTFAILLVLLGSGVVSHTALAAPLDACKLCRDDYQACVKAHSQGACKTNQDICMKHCRKK
jgi:hypothetical protein